MPYFRIAHTEHTVLAADEFKIHGHRVLIGRDPNYCELVVHNDTRVSRLHAIVLLDGETTTLLDIHSTDGTQLNGETVETAKVHHGDTIQLGGTLLEYRTDDESSVQAAADSSTDNYQKMLLGQHRLVPSVVGLRYRLLHIDPRSIFIQGDTVRLGEGGLLIPHTSKPEVANTLELEFLWPDGRMKSMLGEVVAEVTFDHHPGLCIKLHDVPKRKYVKLLESVQRSSWINVQTIPERI